MFFFLSNTQSRKHAKWKTFSAVRFEILDSACPSDMTPRDADNLARSGQFVSRPHWLRQTTHFSQWYFNVYFFLEVLEANRTLRAKE
jgi:hypothetical protein